MSSRIAADDGGLWLPTEFPYEYVQETQSEASAEDMALRFAKLRAVGWPVEPIVGPARNTAAPKFYHPLPKTANPSVFHHMQLQRQMYLYKIRAAQEVKSFQYGPTRAVGSGGKRACAGTGVFLPRTFVNRGNRNHYVNGFSSDSPIKKCGAYGQIGKNIEMARFDFPHPQQQMESPRINAMIPDYNPIMVRNPTIMLQQRSTLLGDEKSHVACLPQEWTY